MGPIITEAAVWLPGLFARDSGLASCESDLQIVCLLPGLAVIDSGWFSGLLAADMGQSLIFIYGLAVVCLHVQTLTFTYKKRDLGGLRDSPKFTQLVKNICLVMYTSPLPTWKEGILCL